MTTRENTELTSTAQPARDKKYWIELLRTDVARFNQERPEGYLDLSRSDLSDANLSYANLRSVSLYRTKLTRVQLTATDLTFTNLHGIELDNTTLASMFPFEVSRDVAWQMARCIVDYAG